MTVRCKRGLILALVCVLVLASAVAVAATVLFSFRVKGNINGDTAGVDGLLSLTADNTALSFSAAGETKDVPLCVKNSTGKNIVYHFGLSAKTALTDENTARLAAAILVFFDGKFAGTLAELTAGGEAAIGQGLVMGKSENTTEMTHTLSFQLHIAAEESLLRQAMEITVTTYAENADYRTVLFVSTEEEFQRAADDINPDAFPNAISDDTFEKIVAILRIAVPYTGLIISTRESKEARRRVLNLGVSQISSGSRTSVGGYVKEETTEENSAQFDVNDNRSLDEVVNWLLELGYIPSFCTACYREGRTGDRFMKLVKSGQIANCCQPNAIMTLKEYLEDYASPDTREKGEKVIAEELKRIPNEKVRRIAAEHLTELHNGKRDFRF